MILDDSMARMICLNINGVAGDFENLAEGIKQV